MDSIRDATAKFLRWSGEQQKLRDQSAVEKIRESFVIPDRLAESVAVFRAVDRALADALAPMRLLTDQIDQTRRELEQSDKVIASVTRDHLSAQIQSFIPDRVESNSSHVLRALANLESPAACRIAELEERVAELEQQIADLQALLSPPEPPPARPDDGHEPSTGLYL